MSQRSLDAADQKVLSHVRDFFESVNWAKIQQADSERTIEDAYYSMLEPLFVEALADAFVRM